MIVKSHGQTLVDSHRLVTVTVLEFSDDEIVGILLKHAASLRPDIGTSSGASTIGILNGRLTLKRMV